MSLDAERLAEIRRRARDAARSRLGWAEFYAADVPALLDALTARILSPAAEPAELAAVRARLTDPVWMGGEPVYAAADVRAALDAMAARDAELARLRAELDACTVDGQRMAGYLDAAETEGERLSEIVDAIQPGRPEAFVAGMFDEANRLGRVPMSSRHALGYLTDEIDRLRARALAYAGYAEHRLSCASRLTLSCTCGLTALTEGREPVRDDPE